MAMTVTMGNFDGVHLGHLEVAARALDSGERTAAVCFEPVTRQYFSRDAWRRRLTTVWERYTVLMGAGMDRVELIPFHKDTVQRGPDDFLEELHGRLSFSRIVVGYDFHFGRNRSGTAEYLQRWCTSRGIDTIIVPPLEIRGEPVKSERLRLLLEKGDLEYAGELLGRPYSLTGVVARGKGLGRELGFPTLNIRVPACKLLPMSGSYCGHVYSGDGAGRMTAAVFVPDRAAGPVEAHVPDVCLSGSYGSLVRVELVERIREIVHARSAHELQELIAGDIEVVRRFEKEKGRMEDPRA
jgi:riboflavin kinase/FMN adenylyltransferase